jgi:hypothetical protein
MSAVMIWKFIHMQEILPDPAKSDGFLPEGRANVWLQREFMPMLAKSETC